MWVYGELVTSVDITLLAEIAERGRMVCDHIAVRKLWYAGLVEWCSPTEVRLTSAGLAALYRNEEEQQEVCEICHSTKCPCRVCHRRKCDNCAHNMED